MLTAKPFCIWKLPIILVASTLSVGKSVGIEIPNLLQKSTSVMMLPALNIAKFSIVDFLIFKFFMVVSPILCVKCRRQTLSCILSNCT